jgi:hypothetical protein
MRVYRVLQISRIPQLHRILARHTLLPKVKRWHVYARLDKTMNVPLPYDLVPHQNTAHQDEMATVRNTIPLFRTV